MILHELSSSLDERIAVQAEDMVTGSDSLQYLTPGIELPIIDLVTLMIIESDNTAHDECLPNAYMHDAWPLNRN